MTDPRFILKAYSVLVQGYGFHTVYSSSPGKARAKSYSNYCASFDSTTFKDFMKISRVCRDKSEMPETFGAPITVGGKEAFFVDSNRQYVRFVRPDSDVIMSSHPYDVEPEHFRPDSYRKIEETL